MNHDENDRNILSLKELMQTGKKVAVFVGAGASRPVGICSWDELLQKMAEEFKSSINVNESIRRIGYPATASRIYDSYEEPDRHEKYLHFLHEQCEPTNANFTSLHLKIVDVFGTIMTTNFDVILENAMSERKLKYNRQKLPNFDPFKLFDCNTIVYLHGNSDENKYIFRKEEYDHYYPTVSNIQGGSGELESFLKSVLQRITLVFIAFSFADKYFSDFLAKVLKEDIILQREVHKTVFHKEHPGETVDHFVIIDNERDAGELRNMGLRIITYESKHVQIENIIGRLQPVSPKTEDAPEEVPDGT